MTRKEEIARESKKFAKEIDDWEIAEDVQDAFEQGAQWADETMIDKACEWLELNVCNAYNFRGDDISIGFVEQFRKAMKGGKK